MGTLNLNQLVKNAVKTATDLVGTTITIRKASERGNPLGNKTTSDHNVDAVILAKKFRRVKINTPSVSGSTSAGPIIEGMMGGAIMRADQNVTPTNADSAVIDGEVFKIVSVETLDTDGQGDVFYKLLWEV